MTALNNTLGGTAGFGENSIGRNDDGSFLLNITSVFENGINFYGTNYTSVYINTNGNITFGSPQSTYTPSGIAGVTVPMIAPFFADVDTRGGATTASPGGTSTGSNLIWYDLDTVNDVITITWDDVGYYNRKTNKKNAFQMELIDLGGGDWTVRFVYENIDWTTGDASGGSNGLGGTVATAGFTSGNGVDYYQLPTSGNQTSMLNLDVNNGNQGEQAVWEFLSEGGSVFDLAISANAVNEFAAGGTVVGTLSSVAVGPSATFSLLDDAGGRFVIIGNQLRVADGVLLDYEQRQREMLTVQVFDGTASATFDLEINIANVDPEVITAGDAGYTIVGGGLNDTISAGSGSDILNGGGGNDTLSSGGGNDVLDGGTGADTLTGGTGDDTYYVDNASDAVVELSSNTGTDLVYSTVTFSAAGANQSGIENITLTGTGNINATGNALANVLTGNSGNNVLDGGTGADTLTGGAGSDTYYVDNVGDTVVELASDAGTDLVYSTVTFSAAGTNQSGIEAITLTGTANINATGNALNNTLVGNGADNALDGGTGTDTMTGGAGNDTYYVDNAGDVVVDLSSDAGTDTVFSAVTFSAAGANQSGIENITLTGTANINGIGNALNNIIIGNSGNNSLDGGDGNDQLYGNDGVDTLIGGLGDDLLDGGTGADTMTGGAGNDTYYVDNAGDVVVDLSSDAGTDTIFSSVTFSAAGANQSGIEAITLIGTGNINATGNALANILTGNSGNNVLDGGTGADTMTGGAGSDTYTVDNVGDVVVDLAADAGTDLVNASVTFSAAGANQSGIENITLTGTANINATGNALANVLTGNSGDNVLDGGTGADTMTGGAGSDTYSVDDAGDVVVDLAADAGTDLVNASVTFSAAGANQSGIENITLTGTANINATGNGLDNVLVGNAGDNILAAGAGNDTYYIQNVGDVVIDRATDFGIDIVHTTVSFSAAGASQDGIENITLTGTANIDATGNALANVLTGNSGNNVLDGGLGADTLTGGAGSDTYYVDDAGDVVIDRATDAGTDLVYSLVTFAATGMDQDGVENITLTGAADVNATGNALNNIIIGNTGNNTLTGGAGDDRLTGNDGNDTLTGGANADRFVYDIHMMTTQADTATDFSIAQGDRVDLNTFGPASWDVLNSHLLFDVAGTATLLGRWNSTDQTLTLTGVSKASLSAAQFVFDTSATARNVTGTANHDTIFGGLGNDTLNAGDGHDRVFGDAGNDIIYGEGGNDSLFGHAGNDMLYGGDGHDRLIGGDGDDTLDAGSGNNHLDGGAGNDILIGGVGNDYMIGGTGADSMTGGAGNDTYFIDDAGDTVTELASDAGIDWIYSNRSLTLSGSMDGVENVVLEGTGNLNVTGNALKNHLYGTSGDNVLDGGDGDDSLNGGDGNDTLIGGAGHDTLNGGTGADTMTGGSGNDVYFVDNAGDIVNEAIGDGGIDTVNTTISFALSGTAAGVERANALGTGNIDLTGNGFDNFLTGNDGNNVLSGGAGIDTLRGGAGNDTLIGGTGNDVLTGGTGADTFVFAGTIDRDRITDFNVAEDKLDLTAFGIDSAAELLPFAVNSGANVFINFGSGQTITINSFTVAQINDGMFVT